MWMLNIPDILVFFAIFGFGFLMGLFFSIFTILFYCWEGGAIHIKHVKDVPDELDNF